MNIQIIVLIIIVLIPFALTIINTYALIKYLWKKKMIKYEKVIETLTLFLIPPYLTIYIAVSEIMPVDYYVQLYNNERHSMLLTDSFVSIIVLLTLSLFAYFYIRYQSASKQTPILSTVSLSLMYIGVILSVIWIIQVYPDIFLIMVSLNIVLIFLKVIMIFIKEMSDLIQNKTINIKYNQVSTLLNKGIKLPWLALLLVLPILGIILIVLILFGQSPADFIQAWTKTADWNLSMESAPQNIYYDQHYLCTVAAGGHVNVVKPLREGKRGGNKVLVNRQLCIANAFEQIIAEHTPIMHKNIRYLYDKYGYPVAKHINSKYTADLVYYLMKPLEWIFLFVIYLFDSRPEDRIAVQYPHKKLEK